MADETQTTAADPKSHTWDAIRESCMLCGAPMDDARLLETCPEQTDDGWGDAKRQDTTAITDEQVRAYLTAVHGVGREIPSRSVGDWLEAGKAHLEAAARVLRKEQVNAE